MRYTAIILIAILLSSCSGFDFSKSLELSKKAAELIKQKNFASLEDIYSYDFKNSESPSQRETKYKMVMDAAGEIQSYEQLNPDASPLNENSEVEYSYSYKCSNFNFIVKIRVSEDLGKYEVSSISILQE